MMILLSILLIGWFASTLIVLIENFISYRSLRVDLIDSLLIASGWLTVLLWISLVFLNHKR